MATLNEKGWEQMSAAIDPEYTADPQETTLLPGLPPVYWEEPGAEASTASALALRPCAQCGKQVLEGDVGHGRTVLVEPERATYVVVWLPKEPRPRLSPSRGYPEHRCAPRET
jgi:hypothetical protein